MRLAGAALAACLGAGAGTAATLALARPEKGAAVIERIGAGGPALASSPTGVAAVASKVMPSIVKVDVSLGGSVFGSGQATGSGVIFTPDGYILTNNHVVSEATSIQVTLDNGEKLPARLAGSAAPSDDISVIKVDRSGLPAATLGSTSRLSVGDLAVAVGSPFGLQGSVTAGVISALHRSIDLGNERIIDAIQTDAPINPGNSGGPLADSAGEVIGINTAILGSTNTNAGVGFAIPIDIARRDAEQIIRTGKATRPFLGISAETQPGGGGALIQDVSAGGPAARAGLQAGDLIVGIDGVAVSSMNDVVSRLVDLSPGRTIQVGIVRAGRRLSIPVTLSAFDPSS